jgi:hypothetical protein
LAFGVWRLAFGVWRLALEFFSVFDFFLVFQDFLGLFFGFERIFQLRPLLLCELCVKLYLHFHFLDFFIAHGFNRGW